MLFGWSDKVGEYYMPWSGRVQDVEPSTKETRLLADVFYVS